MRTDSTLDGHIGCLVRRHQKCDTIATGIAAAVWEACEADLDLAICITEGIPVRDMLVVRNSGLLAITRRWRRDKFAKNGAPGALSGSAR